MLTLIVILLDLILIPAVWCFPRIRIAVYTALAVVNIVFYFICSVLFFIRLKKAEKPGGRTLPFLLIQLLLPAALFLFKLTEVILSHACR